MSLTGYARVSTDNQSLGLQIDALHNVGCGEGLEDQGISGAMARRPGLSAARLASDVLTVRKLDRLGRSRLDLMGLPKARGVGLKALTGKGATIDTTRAEGRLILAVLAAPAEFGRELIRERTKAGIVAAKWHGRYVGRSRTGVSGCSKKPS